MGALRAAVARVCCWKATCTAQVRARVTMLPGRAAFARFARFHPEVCDYSLNRSKVLAPGAFSALTVMHPTTHVVVHVIGTRFARHTTLFSFTWYNKEPTKGASMTVTTAVGGTKMPMLARRAFFACNTLRMTCVGLELSRGTVLTIPAAGLT